MAIGFMFLYAQLANVLTTQALFYTIIFPFIGFFASFAFVLYPLRDVLHPNEFCDWLLSIIGERFSAPVAILRNWTFCLFYVMAELWGSVVVSVLFWVRSLPLASTGLSMHLFRIFAHARASRRRALPTRSPRSMRPSSSTLSLAWAPTLPSSSAARLSATSATSAPTCRPALTAGWCR